MNRQKLLLGALVLFLVVLPLTSIPEFWITQLNYIGLYAIVAMGLVLLTGVAGLTSFGQAAFVGIGAYSSAWLALNSGLSPWAGLLLGLAITGISAWLLGLLTLRMSGHYLPLATIAWGLSLYYLMGTIDELGKYDGLLGVPALSIGDITLNDGRSQFWLIWSVAGLCAWGLANLLNSRPGRAIRSLKYGNVMAEAMGVTTFRYKVIVFILAALLASISGWLFAHFQRTVNPSPFGMKMGIEYLFMAVVGGVGQIGGAFLGSAIVKIMEDQLQLWLPKIIGANGNYEVIVFGVLLVVILKYAPNGIAPIITKWLPKKKSNFEINPNAEKLPLKVKPAKGTLVLDVVKARKEFGGLVAVNDVTFQVKAGEIVGLIGPNGAGKSTTFNLVTGVHTLTSGEIYFNGEKINGIPSREIAIKGLSRTFQHVKMVPDMTVLENVALGAYLRTNQGTISSILHLERKPEQQILADAMYQLERIGLADLANELAGNLAMGQQRLLEIARGLCSDPIILLLDEPAAGLRHKEKAALGNVLSKLREEGMSILLVEHDMDFVMGLTDRIVVMEFGTKLMEGTPQEVQESPAVRAAYLGVEH
jgi:branched-chain amino acid transport system permease protein